MEIAIATQSRQDLAENECGERTRRGEMKKGGGRIYKPEKEAKIDVEPDAVAVVEVLHFRYANKQTGGRKETV